MPPAAVPAKLALVAMIPFRSMLLAPVVERPEILPVKAAGSPRTSWPVAPLTKVMFWAVAPPSVSVPPPMTRREPVPVTAPVMVMAPLSSSTRPLLATAPSMTRPPADPSMDPALETVPPARLIVPPKAPTDFSSPPAVTLKAPPSMTAPLAS